MSDGDVDDRGTEARGAHGDADPGKGSQGSDGPVPDDPWRKLSYEPSRGPRGDAGAGEVDDPDGEAEGVPTGSGETACGDDEAGGEEGSDSSDEGGGYEPEDRGSGLIGRHAHETPHPQDWPYLERGDEKGIDKHPYCEDCGLVKHVGPDRPLPGGGLVNLVARVRDRLEREGRTVTDAQKRLVMQRLRDGNVDDDWGLDRATQLEQFEEVVSEVTGVEPSFVHGIMHDILERHGRRV